MPQTLSEYLDNPMGKGSTAIGNRQLIKDNLNNRYAQLLQRHKSFKFTVYRDDDEYYFHFLIPSETKRENTYDVVIHFTMDDENLKYNNYLYSYCLNFFSNCPSFTYTYAYVYYDYELLIPFLKDKYNSIVLKDNPVTRNPGEIISFEKSLYFACKYLQEHRHLLNKMNINPIAKKLNRKQLSDEIRNTDTIDIEIKKEESRLTKEKEEQEKTSKRSKEKRPDVKPSMPKITQSSIKKGIQKIGSSKKHDKIKATRSTIPKDKK